MSTLLSALRSALFLLVMTATVIPWAIAALVVSIFTRGAPVYWVCAHWLKVVIHACRVICGVRWRVQGLEHLPQTEKGAVILLPKHQSTWETFFFPMLMSHPLAYVFKRELLYIPFFGWAIGRCDMIHIDRRKRTEAWNLVAEQGKRLAAEGIWVIMFPEGTRIPRGKAGDYKSGGTRLSVATGVPVVPIAVTSARCWPRKSFLIRPGVIDVSIGAPISPEGREPAEMMKQVSSWIEAEMRRLDPEGFGPEAPSPARPVNGQPDAP